VQIDAGIALASAPVGLLIGLTSTGGGALLTPMLVVLFHVKSATAISSDLVASVFIRPIAAAVHIKRQTVNYALVGLLSLGSIPMAFVGAELRHQMTRSVDFNRVTAILLGLMLITGALVLCARDFREKRQVYDETTLQDRFRRDTSIAKPFTARPFLTLAIGMFGGICVAMTSVGAGAVMIALLVLVYPALNARHLVGTDLAQAVPLTLAAAIGSLLFSHVNLSLAGSIMLGGVPGVAIGAAISSRAPTRAIQPLVALAIFFSGLKFLWLNDLLIAMLLVLAAITLPVLEFRNRRSRARSGDLAQENPRSIYSGSDTGLAINCLSQQVGVPVVSGVLLNQMKEDPAHRHVLVTPSRADRDLIKRGGLGDNLSRVLTGAEEKLQALFKIRTAEVIERCIGVLGGPEETGRLSALKAGDEPHLFDISHVAYEAKQ